MRSALGLRAAGFLAVSLCLSSCSSSATSPHSPVAWLALAPVSTTTTTSTTTTLAASQPCVASQLRASVGRGGAATGNVATVIVVANVGRSCRLSGYPNLFGHTATRAPAMLAVRKAGTFFGNLVATDLARGQRGELLLGTGDGCAALNEPTQAQDRAHQRADTYHRVRIILPDGRGSLNLVKVTFDVACGLDESQLGVQPPTPGETIAPPGSPASLEVTLSLPGSVQSGTTLKYSISMHNPTTTTVTWKTCPNYVEEILTTPQVGGSVAMKRTYHLNCAAAADVPPGKSERFLMEFPIGRVARSSRAKFFWQLEPGIGPSTAGGILVFAGG